MSALLGRPSGAGVGLLGWGGIEVLSCALRRASCSLGVGLGLGVLSLRRDSKTDGRLAELAAWFSCSELVLSLAFCVGGTKGWSKL